MNWHAVIQRISGTGQLTPDEPLTEQPAVVGRLFAGWFAVFVLVWEVTAVIVITRDVVASVSVFSPAVPPISHLIVIPLGFLTVFSGIALLAVAVAFLTARVVWRQLVVDHDRLTYARSVGAGLLIGMGVTLVFDIVLSIAGYIVLTVGDWVVRTVIGMDHVSLFRSAIIVIVGTTVFVTLLIGTASLIKAGIRPMWVLVAGTVPIGYGIITVGISKTVGLILGYVILGSWVVFLLVLSSLGLTLGIPLVLPVVICVWLSRRSRRDSSADPTAA